jgi:hypothetical protein
MNNKILGSASTLARRIAKVYGRNVYVATGIVCLVNNTLGRR